MPLRQWTSHELRYLDRHAGDGAKEIAKALGRSEQSVKAQAKRMGISLKYRQTCPRCGQLTAKRLNPRTGWCACCTKEARARELAQESAAFEEEAKREARANKERQRLYNRKYLAKKKIRKSDTKSDTHPDLGKR